MRPISAIAAGPDVIVGFVDNGREDGRNASGLVGLTASTNSCNAGDAPLDWEELPNNKHPVISLNLYRLAEGRMEQLAKSWVKHGFFATNRNQCAGISGIARQCQRGPGGHQLRPGCSDLYDESLNADPGNLGPRSKINPTTGSFDGPSARDLTGYPSSQGVERIMLVDERELNQGNARFFLEAHYITADDATAGNARNNTTFREVKPTLQGGAWVLRNITPETRMEPAISAWAEEGAELSEVVTDEGNGAKSYVIVAYKVTQMAANKFRYDYAIYNMNSDLAVSAMSVPVGNSVLSNIGFKGVNSNGEIWSNTPWTNKALDGKVTWSTQSFTENKNANALRWGTTYNFWFETSTPPVRTQATLTRFKPGPVEVAASVITAVLAPAR